MAMPHPDQIQAEWIDDASARRVVPVNGFVISDYDYIGLTYTGANLTTVVYKKGGSGGTVVATLTLAYTGAVLDSITKT